MERFGHIPFNDGGTVGDLHNLYLSRHHNQFQESFACPPCLRLFIHSITGVKGQRDPLALLNSECMLQHLSKTREEVFLFPCAVRGGRALSHGDDNCIWPLNPLLRIIMNYHGVLVVKFKHAIAVQQEAKLFCSHTRPQNIAKQCQS